jgi:hypothetical protein
LGNNHCDEGSLSHEINKSSYSLKGVFLVIRGGDLAIQCSEGRKETQRDHGLSPDLGVALDLPEVGNSPQLPHLKNTRKLIVF